MYYINNVGLFITVVCTFTPTITHLQKKKKKKKVLVVYGTMGNSCKTISSFPSTSHVYALER